MRELATGKRPPGPKGRLLGGNFTGFRRDSLGYLQSAAAEHGDVVYLRFGPQEVFFLAHPDHVRDVLVTHHQSFMKGRALQRAKRLLGEGLLTSEGEFHQRQRRLAQPAFHRARINSYGAVMTEYAARAASRWRDGETVGHLAGDDAPDARHRRARRCSTPTWSRRPTRSARR